MKDDILKRLVTWATGVNTLNGTYTLSKQQYQELRAMQKNAMEALVEPVVPTSDKLKKLADYVNMGLLSQQDFTYVIKKLYPPVGPSAIRESDEDPYINEGIYGKRRVVGYADGSERVYFERCDCGSCDFVRGTIPQ